MNTIPDTKHGKEFEAECNKHFGKLYMNYRVRWERVIDSAAANTLIKSADGDYRLLAWSGCQGRPYLIYLECKASKQGKPFKNIFRSLVKGGQNASLQMARRGGAESCVFFYNMAEETVEVWRGKDINEHYPNARKPILADPACIIPFNQLHDFAQWIANHVGDFCDLLTGNFDILDWRD